jgi:hypothetical protein
MLGMALVKLKERKNLNPKPVSNLHGGRNLMGNSFARGEKIHLLHGHQEPRQLHRPRETTFQPDFGEVSLGHPTPSTRLGDNVLSDRGGTGAFFGLEGEAVTGLPLGLILGFQPPFEQMKPIQDGGVVVRLLFV